PNDLDVLHHETRHRLRLSTRKRNPARVDRDHVEAGEDVDEVAGLKLAGQSAGRVERNRDHPLSIGERTGKRSRRSGEVCRRELLATVDSVAGGATGQTGRVADRALLELALADGLRR